MKKTLLAIALISGACLSAAPANAQGIPGVAANLRSNLNYLYDVSLRVGDYGYALNDLANLRSAADRFAYTLSYADYQGLRYAYDTSSRSWTYLRSYQYERFRFSDVELNVQHIANLMDRPLPIPQPPRPLPPQGPRHITVTGQGSGGTTHGDRAAACSKAEDRALNDLNQACASQRGLLQDSSLGSCDCSRKPGSKDDYTCRVQARGTCEVRGFSRWR